MDRTTELMKKFNERKDRRIALGHKIVEDINLLTGGHEGNPIKNFRDWDAHRYDFGTFTDPNNSVNWYKKKLADKERVTLDDVVMYNVLQAFNAGVEDTKLFAEHAGKAIAILKRIIFLLSVEEDS